MSEIEDIKFLRDNTGCGIVDAKKALDLCKNKIIALEYLYLKGHAIARYKYVNGKKIPWENIDYYREAKMRGYKNEILFRSNKRDV
jgi:hypothetical protein